jgi:hypothetical protein
MAGRLITHGILELKGEKMAANTIWADARPNIMLHVMFPSADAFMFSTGGLWSLFVDSQQIPHTLFCHSSSRSSRLPRMTWRQACRGCTMQWGTL